MTTPSEHDELLSVEIYKQNASFTIASLCVVIFFLLVVVLILIFAIMLLV